jgi:Tfp pilus assembly protein PilF
MPQCLERFARTAGAVILVVATLGATCGAVHHSPSAAGRAAGDAVPPSDDPTKSTDFIQRCLELIRHGQPDRARKLLEPAVAGRPDWAEAHASLGLTYFNEKRWGAAKDLYRRALELDPDFHAARVPYAWSLYYLGQLDASRESFEAYLEVDPDYADAVFALGLIQFDSDELDSAERSFRRVVMMTRAVGDSTRQALARARLGDVYMRNGDLPRAKLELKQSILLNPQDPKAHFKMSRVLQLMGDAEGAAVARKRFDELRAGSPSTSRDEARAPTP